MASSWGALLGSGILEAAPPPKKRQRTLTEMCGAGSQHAGEGEDPGTVTEDYVDAVGPVPKPWKVHSDDRQYDLETGALWSVDVSVLTPEEVAGHLELLTCVPNKGKKTGFAAAAKPFHIGFVSRGRLYMPPIYASQAFGSAENCLPGSRREGVTAGEPMREEAVFMGTLWEVYPPQNQAVEAWGRYQPRKMPGIMSLPCGHGKSRAATAAAAKYVRRVTLILVHKRPLVPQWMEEIITLVPKALVGILVPEMQIVDGVDFIVASMQCLHSHLQSPESYPYLEVLRRRVGFVILDEAHHGVANTFQHVMSHLPAAERLAITATPRRKDNLFEELQYIFGPVIFRSFRRPGDGQAVMLRYNSPVLKEHKKWGNLRVDLMEDDLVEDAERDLVIVSLAAMLAIKQGRRVVVVTPRAAHVLILRDKIQEAIGDALSPRPVSVWVPEQMPSIRKRKHETAVEVDARRRSAILDWQITGPHGEMTDMLAPVVGVVTSTMKSQTERQRNYEAAVVVATSDMLEEGISYKDWDTLLDTDNSSDSEQIVGRIQRAGVKKVPLVVDLFSPVSLYVGLKNKRLKFYVGEQFGMHHVEVSAAADLPDASWWEQFNRFTQSAL